MLKFHLFRTTDYEMVVPSRIAQVLFSPAFIYKRTMRSEKMCKVKPCTLFYLDF